MYDFFANTNELTVGFDIRKIFTYLNNVIVEKKIIERAKPLSKLEKEKCIEKVLKDNNIGGTDQIISDINKQSTGIKITKTKIAITQNK